MPIKKLVAGRWMVGLALALSIWSGLQVAVALAAAPDTYAMPQVVAQVPTPTPFRFLTPTPIVRTSTSTTTATPNGGGFPVELALPMLAGGLTALGGGSFLLRRKPTR